MEIRENIIRHLNSLYNFVLDHEVFDHVTTLVLGKTTTELKAIQIEKLKQKAKQELEESNNLLLDTLVSEYELSNQRVIARSILKNQLEYISRESPLIDMSKITTNRAWMMGIAAKVVKQILILDGVVGIQPLSDSVDLVYSMTYNIKDKISKEVEKDAEYPTKVYEALSNYKVALEIVSSAVQAISRKLQAGWNIEAVQDVQAFHDIDAEKKIISIASHEVGVEIIWEVISDLVTLAKKNPVSQRITFTPSKTPTFFSEHQEKLLIGINQNANGIARATRRGTANKIITTPLGVTLLQSLKYVRFVSSPKETYNGDMESLRYVRYIASENEEEKWYEVYCTLAPALSDSPNTEVNFLVGYKGGNGECDVSYIYSPYIPIMSSGMAIDPVTFQPAVTLSTRYAKWVKGSTFESELGKTESTYVGKASDYYSLLTFEIDVNEWFQ